MGLPINLPRRLVKGKTPFSAEWGNSIREAIDRLAKRMPPIQPAVGVSIGSTDPWTVTISRDPDTDVTTANIEHGTIYDSFLSVDEKTITNTLADTVVVDGDLVVLRYTYATATETEIFDVVIVAEASFDPYDDDAATPPEATIVRYPLAKITDPPEDVGETASTVLIVEQIAKDNFAMTTICYDGIPLTYFTHV